MLLSLDSVTAHDLAGQAERVARQICAAPETVDLTRAAAHVVASRVDAWRESRSLRRQATGLETGLPVSGVPMGGAQCLEVIEIVQERGEMLARQAVALAADACICATIAAGRSGGTKAAGFGIWAAAEEFHESFRHGGDQQSGPQGPQVPDRDERPRAEVGAGDDRGPAGARHQAAAIGGLDGLPDESAQHVMDIVRFLARIAARVRSLPSTSS